MTHHRACPAVRQPCAAGATCRWFIKCLSVFGPALLGCDAVKDEVFEARLVSLITEPVRVPEEAGVVQVPVRLEAPVPTPLSANFEIVGIEAQNDCHFPDFNAASGTLTFEAGSREVMVDVWINEDTLAETDERLEVVLSDLSGASFSGPTSFSVIIEDDDREVLVDGRQHGVVPGTGADMTALLQAALDAAAGQGRSVLLLAPGDYEVSSVSLAAGQTLSARGVRWLRPAPAEANSRVLSVLHAASEDSLPTLIEGLSVDGRRDAQGAFQDYERENEHLIALEASPDEPGRLNVSVEHVNVTEGTGDGVAVGSNTQAFLCHVQAHDIWRDAISLHGGRSMLRVRGFDATASEGTSGIWIDDFVPALDQNSLNEVEIEDARLNTGDVELEVAGGSRVVFRRLSMTEPPFRVQAPNASVEVFDSIIQMGVASERHNFFMDDMDLRLVRTTIVASERIDEQPQTEEQERTFSAVTLRWAATETESAAAGGQVVLESCQLALDDDVETNDTVFGIDNSMPGGTVIVQGSSIAPAFADWFAPDCPESACVLE